MASTVVLGARAIARGVAPTTGLVTELPDVRLLGLVPLDRLVFGGWDITRRSLADRARALAADDRAVPPGLVEELRHDLDEVESHIRPGVLGSRAAATRSLATRAFVPARETLGATVERLGDDLDRFRQAQKLDSVVVVNLASTEPPIALGREHERLDAFRGLVQRDRRTRVTPGMLYAYAALGRGYPYVNFTPSPALAPAALRELALKQHVPFCGNDGKTGETLMKSVLATLFRCRNLEVLSWEGFNILGGGDGRVLSDPRHKRSKVASKSRVLAGALGYAPHANVSIEYVPSLGNWKTAWDFVHFRGFLGTKMSLQFTWQGCDSILAAPLVLDLVRLVDFAHRHGEAGAMAHLACFFKDPIGVATHAFTEQFALLLEYVARHRQPTRSGPRPR